MSTFDIALKSFTDYKHNYVEHPYSESDTRSKNIDFIFKDVLGWGEENIRREGNIDSGYFDYIFSLNNFKFVVEAKKSAVDFNLPIKGRRHKIGSIEKLNPSFVKQIRGYITDCSLSFGVLTNGKQFIIGRFNNNDGNDWILNDCVVFQNLDIIESHFSEFYNILSKEAIEVNGRFKIQTINEFRRSIYEDLPHKNKELIRNDFSGKLLPIIDKIFNEIGKTKEGADLDLLKQCYIPSLDIHKHTEELRNLFIDLPPQFDGRIQKVKNTGNLAEQVKANLLANNQSPSPIILIGGKGAGKTTFIQFFFKVILNSKEARNSPAVYLDFRNYTKQQIEDTKSIYEKVLNALLTEHESLRLADFKILKQIFAKEIEQKKAGTWAFIKEDEGKLNEKIAEFIEVLQESPEFCLQKISEYLMKFQRRHLCIVFDNADQLDNQSQEKVFLLAQSLKGTINCIVFVSLREGYYYQWRHKPPFDAFHSNVYHISAPPYKEVLKKRIEYILQNVEFEPINTYTENKRIEFDNKTLKHLFLLLHRSLFSNNNSDIMKYLEQTSYPNIRKGLEQMNNFLVSGHTKIDQYITSQPYIPIWEFIKSISLNNKLYYHSDSSPIYNLFVPGHVNSDHFLKIKILSFLNEFAKKRAYKDGYLPFSNLLFYFQNAGYSCDVFKAELKLLAQYGLIDTENHSSDISAELIVDENIEITISNTGIYYFNDLVYRFHYIDLILQDTPFFDKIWFEKVSQKFAKSDSYGNRDLYLREQTVTLFLKYLEFEEQRGVSQNNFNSEDSEKSFSVFDYIYSNYQTFDKQRIEKVLTT